MDDEELALKLFERYLAVKKDSVNVEEVTDIYFNILNKVKSNRDSSYSVPVSTSSSSTVSLDDLPGMSAATETTTVPESIGIFDLSQQTTQTECASEVNEEKDIMDQEKYLG